MAVAASRSSQTFSVAPGRGRSQHSWLRSSHPSGHFPPLPTPCPLIEFIKTRKSGIFETYVRFGGSGTSFSPTCAELGDALEGLFDTMITTVGNVNRVSYLSGQVHQPTLHYPTYLPTYPKLLLQRRTSKST